MLSAKSKKKPKRKFLMPCKYHEMANIDI